MSNIDIAIGVVDGAVIAKWKDPTTTIAFDPKNAYLIGMALSKAAIEAHRGSKQPDKDLKFIEGALAQVKVKLSDVQRLFLIDQVATILKTLRNQAKSDRYIAQHCVDTVLVETAR